MQAASVERERVWRGLGVWTWWRGGALRELREAFASVQFWLHTPDNVLRMSCAADQSRWG